VWAGLSFAPIRLRSEAPLCADEGAAKERAKLLVDNRVIELWQSDHKIATFEPDPLKAEEAQGWLKGELRPPT
jgi:hypothetical protein